MKIQLHAIAGLPGAAETEITVDGDIVTYDGTDYDLSAVPEGGEAWPEGESPFVGVITRKGGEIACGLLFSYDAATAMPHQNPDPAHWVVTVTSGAVVAPIARLEVTE